MKLSDVVSAAQGLAIYAEAALVLFLAAFVAVALRLASRKHRDELEETRLLPLMDEPSTEHDFPNHQNGQSTSP
jgi:hypothetical protein